MRDDLLDLARSIDPTVLGDRLRQARQRAGLTQAQVAGDTVSVGYVSRIESGQRRPDPQLLETIAGRARRHRRGAAGRGLARPSHRAPGPARPRRARARHRLGEPGSGDRRPDPRRPAVEELPDLEREASYLRAGALEATGDLQCRRSCSRGSAQTEPGDLRWIDGITAPAAGATASPASSDGRSRSQPGGHRCSQRARRGPAARFTPVYASKVPDYRGLVADQRRSSRRRSRTTNLLDLPHRHRRLSDEAARPRTAPNGGIFQMEPRAQRRHPDPRSCTGWPRPGALLLRQPELPGPRSARSSASGLHQRRQTGPRRPVLRPGRRRG